MNFGWEPLERIFAEPNFGDLMHGHWEEAGQHRDKLPLDPDIEAYLKLEAEGSFKAWAARADKTLAGYVGCHLVHDLLTRTPTALLNPFILAPPWRRGSTAILMFQDLLDALKPLGVRQAITQESWTFAEERGKSAGVMFRFLGFEPVAFTWSRILD